MTRLSLFAVMGDTGAAMRKNLEKTSQHSAPGLRNKTLVRLPARHPVTDSQYILPLCRHTCRLPAMHSTVRFL